jgi:hypothetical protein
LKERFDGLERRGAERSLLLAGGVCEFAVHLILIKILHLYGQRITSINAVCLVFFDAAPDPAKD